MRTVCLSLVVGATLASGGCLQSNTVIRINGDGSGTIQLSSLYTAAAIAEMRRLAALEKDPDSSKVFDPSDPVSERDLLLRLYRRQHAPNRPVDARRIP